MAHLLPNHVSVSTTLFAESNCGFYWGVRDGKAKNTEMARSWRPPCLNGRFCGNKKVTAVSATDQEMSTRELIDDGQPRGDLEGIDDPKFRLVEENGWKVRRMAEEDGEMRGVANIQAEAFHEPVALFDGLFFQFFKAEVLSALLYRLKNSPPDRYACLVAVPTASTSEKQEEELVGVADVTVSRDRDVVEQLFGAEDYLYVSGIAVSKSHRRKKVATALLKACEVISTLWGYEYLALRAYENDWGARALYENAGYRVVSGDTPWVVLIGRRRRILMVKRCSSCESDHSD